jgi:hypothetical protein
MFKAVDKWFPGYLRSLLRRPRAVSGTRHLIFCVCDHYEPFRDGAEAATARNTVQDWLSAYPAAIDPFRDADGRRPRHTFFYPQEDYDESILDRLGDFCRRGFGEVEIHLHHRHDTAAGFREKLVTFRDRLHERHGLLGVERPKGELSGCQVVKLLSGNPKAFSSSGTQQPDNSTTDFPIRYGFIHGNWALCNSRPDGDWCGVNEELGILAETGCYADFTFPSAPSPTQPRMVNALYYAQDAPGQPRGADRGELSSCQAAKLLRENPAGEPIATQQLNNETTASRLLLITGPLALNGARRKWGLFPRLENAGITGVNPPTSDRVRLWARQGIHVTGLPEWVFVKVHTHGCVPGNAGVILGEAMRQAHETLDREFNDGRDWKLHYVTAREMYNLVKAAEAGATGEPDPWRDFKVAWVH